MVTIHRGGGGTRIPVATYRLQLNGGFGFRDAESIVGYLGRLGVSDLYASPILKARAGSSHCYDVVDHGALNGELGTEGELAGLVRALRRRGMGLLVDIVPNHMAASGENRIWNNLLEYGPASPYSRFFDVDWSSPARGLKNRVLLPVLTEAYPAVLSDSRTRVEFDPGEARLYFRAGGADRVPLTPASYAQVLEGARRRLGRRAGEELGRVLSSTAASGAPGELEEARFAPVYREGEVIKSSLARLCGGDPRLVSAISAAVEEFNLRDERGRRAGRFDSLLLRQFYQLSHWREASEKINYRRFVLVNDLVALSAERPEVFEESHRLLLEMVANGSISGLRVDHCDGLADPEGYFRRLRRGCSKGSVRGAGPPYVVAEKILSRAEKLPAGWTIQGTTGYDFARDVGALFVRSESVAHFDSIYEAFIGERRDIRGLTAGARRRALRGMGSELKELSRLLCRISDGLPGRGGLNPRLAKRALVEAVAHFPTYRTYSTPRTRRVGGQDSASIREGMRLARVGTGPGLSRALDLVEDVLLLRVRGLGGGDVERFVTRFQEATVPAAVKGDEDTAYYRYNRLVSLNEVGGDPASFGMSVEEFHRRALERARSWPNAMLATSTHDTKRSEDVRARISALSEVPEEWSAAVSRWSEANVGSRSSAGGEPAPARNEEYLLYQTLVGVWPLSPPSMAKRAALVERVVSYMTKAAREAGERTSWTDQNHEYESALERFVRGVLEAGPGNRFLGDFQEFQAKVARLGMLGSLSQLLLKLTCPGVPDLYQGNETWDFSLVDPDNRRRVDFERGSRMLAVLRRRVTAAGSDRSGLARGLASRWRDGMVKLYVTSETLRYRSEHRDLFERGAYLPLGCEGAMRWHVCAFAREDGTEGCVVIAPRFIARLGDGLPSSAGDGAWLGARVELGERAAGRRYRNLFTGRVLRPGAGGRGTSLAVSDALDGFPVALLVRE